MKNWKAHTYWKHEAQVDTFLYVHNVLSDTGHEAKVNGCWMTQGHEIYCFASHAHTIHINKNHYSKWKPYNPKGRLIL